MRPPTAGIVRASSISVRCAPLPGLAGLVLAAVLPFTLRAADGDPAEQPFQMFLARCDEAAPSYRATRRLEAASGQRRGWLEAATEYSSETGFRYIVRAEGGSDAVLSRLREVLEGERQTIARGEAARAALEPANYAFRVTGLASDGLAAITLTPRRQERALVAGTMFLDPESGDLVRLEGRLAKSPSFWVKKVDVVRTYANINGSVLPIATEATAYIRILGPATFRMTYQYLEIDGVPVRGALEARR